MGDQERQDRDGRAGAERSAPVRRARLRRSSGSASTSSTARRTLKDTPQVRGMIDKVKHLVRIVDEA